MSAHDNQSTTPDEPREITAADLKLGNLIAVTDVVYGLVLSYGAALMMPLFQRWLETPSNTDAAGKALTLAFVLNYAIADFIEARVITTLVPYEGKGRFSLDLLIAMFFMGALQSAAAGSATVLLSLAFAFATGAIWAAYLKREERRQFRWHYAGCVIATHVVAALICVAAYATMADRGGVWFAMYVWAGYLVWLVIVSGLKLVVGVPDTGFDLLPISLIGLGVSRLMRFIREF